MRFALAVRPSFIFLGRFGFPTFEEEKNSRHRGSGSSSGVYRRGQVMDAPMDGAPLSFLKSNDQKSGIPRGFNYNRLAI
jgi:hypothetical protein